MSTYFQRLCIVLLLVPASLQCQTKAATDPLNRSNPRASVTAFLQTCQQNNYVLAAQYLDLHELPERERASRGPKLARQLEAILNSESTFDVLRLSQSPAGSLSDDADPSLENIASVPQNDKSFTLQLYRTELASGTPVWLFSAATVAAIPSLTPKDTASAIESRLPRFLVTIRLLDTPIWKWLALILIAVVIIVLFQIVSRLLFVIMERFGVHAAIHSRTAWIQPLLQPWLVLFSAIVFGLAEQFIDPSALSRLYIGRVILLVVVWAFAWCFINMVDLFLSRLDKLLDPRQRIVSHSLIYMGQRAAKVTIFVVAAIVVLDNWGYNMTTMIAGLGVGGIAVALAAQGTIANVFGGVSVIADHPVMVGDYGNFGGVLGTVEDIGMRSTRVRTLSRTVMSIPNSSFATINLENYARRDKILFNPTLQIKRGTAREKIQNLITQLETVLRSNNHLEVGPSPIRLTSLTGASIGMEIFAYALTDDIDEFYKIESVLLLDIEAEFAALSIDLV